MNRSLKLRPVLIVNDAAATDGISNLPDANSCEFRRP